MKKIICSLIGAVGSVIVHYLGGWDYFIQTLLIFMVIDYISGLAVAGVFHKSRKTENGKLESNACLKGLSKKMMMLSFVLIGNLLDNAVEACMQVQNKENRFIRIYIDIVKKQLYIYLCTLNCIYNQFCYSS